MINLGLGFVAPSPSHPSKLHPDELVSRSALDLLVINCFEPQTFFFFKPVHNPFPLDLPHVVS